MTKHLALLFFLLASTAYGQGVRYSSTVTQQGTIGTATNAVVLPAGATIAFCNHPANAVPCTNKATTYTDQTLTSSCNTSTQLVLDGTSTCVALPDAQDNWGVWVAPNAAGYDYTIALPGGVNRGPFNVLSQNSTLVNMSAIGPSPWFDVSVNGVDCTGAIDSTTALSTLTTTAKATSNSRIFFPPGCAVKVISWNLSNISTGAPFNIEGGVNGSVSNNPTITFTGNCNGTAALQEATSSQVFMQNISFKFPNATSGPCHDLTGSSGLRFTRVGWTGSGQTVGPLINNVNTTDITFDGWGSCGSASICITGPNTISGSPFSDVTTIRNMHFTLIGTRAINDPSVAWSVEDNLFDACNGSNFVQAVGFDSSNILVSNFNFTGNDIVGGTCVANTSITYVALPVPTFVTSSTFNSNLIIGNLTTPAQNFINLGNNNVSQARGNQFENIGTVFTVGTGVTLNADSNTYLAPVTTWLVGTPQTGRAEDINGGVHNYLNGVDNPNVQRAIVSGSNYTNATTTASNITGLSFSVKASTQYAMTCQLPFSASAGTAGLDITITGPASPTALNLSYTEIPTITTISYANNVTFGVKLVGAGTVSTGQNLMVTFVMNLTNGINAGTVQVQGSATGAGTVTVPIGAFCQLQ